VAEMGIIQTLFIFEGIQQRIVEERLNFLTDVSVAVWADKEAREDHVEGLING